jgi:hypothetical protein
MNAKTKGFMFGVAVGLLIHYGYSRSMGRG